MPRWGYATATTSLLVAVALGVSGCGAAEVAGQPAREAAVDVAAAMGVEGQALAAMGFDATDLDVRTVAAPAPGGSATPGPSPSAGEKARQKHGEDWRKRRQARVLLRRNTLHGEAVVQSKDGAEQTVAVQRGEVTAVDGDSMTVKSTDGFTMTWTFGDDLRVVERRATVQPSEVKVGATLGVAGAKDGDKGVARLILIPGTR
ncbi:hypothetical protein DKT68_10410 [Micromonospora acroterricola]|uniref:DUF5666 domain-containing protein n=1 Tax=Micromonospora acroterricola TaxID=2202421 RepID=A0A317DB04_9ACTN|nr:hypothetical protein [Micromonospora acroterricola]PWR09993.1 hypothetical protein DKT68_10410 [Micromonospora acroterricola]